MFRVILAATLLVACSSPSESTDAEVRGVDSGPCEIDTSSDPNNCGGCGHVCPHLDHTTAACESGACTHACIAGFDDCNGDLAASASDGCETDLQTSADHCGMCGNVCLPGGAPRSVGACEGGECKVGCESGWADCNLDLGNPGTDGCEAELVIDEANCGSCQNACDASCVEGVCEGTTLACSYFAGTLDLPVAVHLAAGSGGFLVVWNDLRLRQLFIELLDSEGRSSGAPTVLVDGYRSNWRYDVGWDGSRFVVVHEDEDLGEVLVSYVSADGSVAGAPETLPGSGRTNSVTVTDAVGGVAAAIDGRTYWISPTGFESGPAAGDFWSRCAQTANGFASLGFRVVPPTPTVPEETIELEHVSLDSSLMIRNGPNALGPGTFSGAALVSFGTGALAVLRNQIGDVGPFTLQVASFDANGEFVSSPTVLAGAPAAGLFELATDDAGVWLVRGGVTVSVQRSEDPLGAFGAASPVATARVGFLSSLTAAANEEGVLAMWRWRSFSGGEDMSAIEGVFVRRDGTVIRPCD